jgi:TnpA family transposase
MTTDQEWMKMNDNLHDHFTHVERAYLGTGIGWYNLIYTLTNCIDCRLEHLNKDGGNRKVVIAQIKEKFGGLRYYADGDVDEQMDGMIDFAEALSYTICEECGAPGKLRSGGWMRTLCDKHEEERQARYKEMK